MRLIHNSRLPEYRSPFGAAKVGTDVTLNVRVEAAPDEGEISLFLRTWVDGEGERRHRMQRIGPETFSIVVPCRHAAIVWYSFIARCEKDGEERELRCGAPQGRTGGEGVTYDYENVPSFQLTVYEPRTVRPSWYENGMVYQIFPDRYRRDPNWRERCEKVAAEPHNGYRRHVVEDWNEPPVYQRNPNNSITTWDFYGGSLKGIASDLDRLEELGITVIYLNPIFEAASNHRYDTADYMKIDPMLGTEEDFRELCAKAKEHGISIILDGVFNHTGDDSIYFNRFENYPGKGAWAGEDSPWRDAYCFNEDGTYSCWWGIGNMPDLNGDSPIVRELLLGEDGVIRHWTRAGAAGWRLDVADELTESLIRDIKTTLLEERPDGLLLGEVWEDASNKESYGHLRHYLLGEELDSAMNYPFRDMVIGFLMGHMSAEDAAEVIESLHENYPPEALACCLNLLGSHDRPRIASVLGGGPDESQLPEEERGRWRLSPEAMGLAKARFWLATLMQMTFPGVPSIYYGDEYCLEGLSDPGNRRTLPLEEDIKDRDMLTIVKNASAVRRALPFMVDGDISAKALDDDVLSYTRTAADGTSATVIINRSRDTSHTVRIAARGEAATDIVSGAELPIAEDDTVGVTLWPFGSAVVLFHDEQRLQKPLERGAGVVCHITSLPSDKGRTGTLGVPARRFIDHLAAMGMRYWQVLPVNPTDLFNSPYAGPSAFAGNIDLLPESEKELRAEFRAWKAKGGEKSDAAYRAFVEKESFWLKPYCAFMSVKAARKGEARHEWPSALSRYDERILMSPKYRPEAEAQAYFQYRFDVEWRRMVAHAHRRGIQIIGDIPMYVSDDSADVWTSPEMFCLDEDGRPSGIAGAPPDGFAPDGQIWGNPTFRWDVMREDGYRWWLARLGRACDLYDRVRLDHFLGFHNYFCIPAGAPGSEGRWLPGPGKELFDRAYEKLGQLPFIAEDLGVLTPGVRSLVATCGFPGMDVLEFSDYNVLDGLHPHPGKIFYTSTHDTSTLVGFCARSFTDNAEYARSLGQKLLRNAMASDAELVMVPLQDILGLDDTARMNVPGVADGNWSWQADEDDVSSAIEDMRVLLEDTGRVAK